jgi:FKBP-type peptidyl-prolyl cis-trans isomerases 1
MEEKQKIISDMKVIKHLSWISSAALISTPMFAKVAKSEASVATKEAPVVVEEKAAPQQQPVVEEKKGENVAAKENAAEAQEVAPTKEQIASYFKTLGWMTIMQSGVKNLGCNTDETSAFLEGVRLALDGKEAPVKLGEVMQSMQGFLQKRAGEFEKKHQEELKMTAEKNRKDGDKFMADLLRKDASIKTTASGLSYKVLAEGDSKNKPSDEDSVEIYYTGKLIDGKVFDESKAKPITFPLNGVVPGIKEGLQLIGQGGKITLYIPDNLAYGEYDIPSIPAGSRLVFDVELVKVVKAEKAPAVLAEPEKEAKAPAAEEKSSK